jgi:DNA recombination-dependent growth factor C
MGLLSTTTSLTRYRVEGQLDEPIIESVYQGLKQHSIADIDENPSDQAVGWTTFQNPYNNGFDDANMMFGTDFVFALRIDKKSIPAKMVEKHIALESEKRLTDLGREFLSADEKRAIKDHVMNKLHLRIPSTPSVYDIVWQYEKKNLWFFSNLKGANEELETLFIKSFGLSLIRSIPYTMAALDHNMTSEQLDALARLSADQNRN